MTALPLRDFTDAERAKLDAIEAAPAAEESVRERLMDALAVELESLGIDGQMSSHACEYLADAALAVLSGPSSDAERAVERVVAEMNSLADAWTSYGGPDTEAGVAADLLRRHLRRAVAGEL